MRALAEDAEVATIGGRTAFTWRQNGNFAPARFAKAEPELAAQYAHLVAAVDTKRLAADHPQTYRKYRSEEHTSDLQSLMRISYAVFCLKNKKTQKSTHTQ